MGELGAEVVPVLFGESTHSTQLVSLFTRDTLFGGRMRIYHESQLAGFALASTKRVNMLAVLRIFRAFSVHDADVVAWCTSLTLAVVITAIIAMRLQTFLAFACICIEAKSMLAKRAFFSVFFVFCAYVAVVDAASVTVYQRNPVDRDWRAFFVEFFCFNVA